MEKNQVYYPDRGYVAPRAIDGIEECSNPAFMDHSLHRIGVFKDKYLTDGLPGWSCSMKCVNCGEEHSKIFIPECEK